MTIQDILNNKYMKRIAQKGIGEKVGLSANFFNDIIHEREKCPPKYALMLAPFTGISLEVLIDPDPKGKRLQAWKEFANKQKKAA